MGVIRGSVGFLAFFAAFSLKSDLFALGVAAAMAVLGGFVGNILGPPVRRMLREEQMLAAALLITASFVLVGTLLATTLAFAVASLAVATGAAIGRLAFDSLIQRDGPDAARGRAFARFETPHGDNHDLWVNPTDGRVMIQANDGGANVSLDGGRTWSTQYNQPTAEIYQVAVDNQYPYRLYGAQQDNSTLIVPSLPTEAGSPDDPIQSWRQGPGCETGPIIPHVTGAVVG